MSEVLFISHPEVLVQPDIAVPQWGLSALGRERMAAFSRGELARSITRIWTSAEVKAVGAAAIFGGELGLTVAVHEGLGENDRSATGFLPPDQFERMADQFFGEPDVSVEGWERAVDAQDRIARALVEVLAGGDGVTAIVSHGGVGTLLLCKYLDVPINRKYDQPGQGHYWRFDADTRQVLHGWRPLAPLGELVECLRDVFLEDDLGAQGAGAPG